jgi:hypothetical protein
MAACGGPGDTRRRCVRELPRRLALLADARGGQPEASAIDLIGHRALVKGLTDRSIQSLQQLGESFSLAPHEACDERLAVDGNRRTLDWRHASDTDVTAFLIQQRGDMRPVIVLLCVRHGVVFRPC